MYEYKTVDIPKTLIAKKGNSLAQELALCVQTLINENCQDGWEFYRADEYSVSEPQGCLAALAGSTGQIGTYSILVFRRNRD